MSLRNAILMGHWYPESPSQTKKMIQTFEESYVPPKIIGKLGGIIPHAGWNFSGKLAYQVIRSYKDFQPDLVAIFGGHVSNTYPPILITNTAWETPFGRLNLSYETNTEILKQLAVQPDRGMMKDPSIEVQIPFIHYFFPNTKLVAIHLPSTLQSIETALAVCQIIESMNEKVLFFGSTDLTHYGPIYNFTPKGLDQKALRWMMEENDRPFIDLALQIEPEKMIEHANEYRSASSAGAAAGVAAIARKKGINEAFLVDYFTSYDIHQDENFVGYAGLIY